MFLIFSSINQFGFDFEFSIFVFLIDFSIGIFLVFNILRFIFMYFYESNKVNNNHNQIKNTKKFDSSLTELKRAMQEINLIVNGDGDNDSDDDDDDKRKKSKKKKLENGELDNNSKKPPISDANSKISVKSEKVPEKWELRWFLTGCAVSAFLIIFFPPRGGWRFFGLNFFLYFLRFIYY